VIVSTSTLLLPPLAQPMSPELAGGPDPSRKYNLSCFQMFKPKPQGMPHFSRFSRRGLPNCRQHHYWKVFPVIAPASY